MMNGLKSHFKKNSASLISGVLAGTSYIPFPPWAVFVAFIPTWLKASRETSWKQVFIYGWYTQFVLTLIGFHWISYTAHEFGSLPWPVAFIALFLFCSLMHLYIPLSMLTVSLLKKKVNLTQSSTIWLFALSLILWERLWPSLFPWHYGYVFLGARWPIYQWADIIGFDGLSAFILLSNAALTIAWLQFSQQRKKLMASFLVFVSLLVILSIGGYFHGQKWTDYDSQIEILAAQANIGNLEKVQAEQGVRFQDEIVDRYFNVSTKGLSEHPTADIIVWPETAFPDFLDFEYKDRPRAIRLRSALKQWNKSLIAGSFSRDYFETNSNKNTFNSVFLLTPDTEQFVKPYRKTQLLAFGEYLPFSERFPILLKLLPFMSNFGRGLGPEVMTFPKTSAGNPNLMDLKIGPQVCYEGLSADFTRQLSLQGAQILVNVTNDSWFGGPFEPQQHMIMTLGRAIEIRRPLIRATNTGISTAILADGTRMQESPFHQVWSSAFDIKFKKNPQQTFYAKYGGLDFWFCLFIFIVIIGKNWNYERTKRP